MRMSYLSLLAAVAAAALACNNDYTLDSKDDEPPPLSLDECAETGDQYMLQLAALGCTVTSGVDIGADVSGSLTIVAIGVGIITASGDYEGGGSCDLVFECQPSTCGLEFITCVKDYGDVPFCLERAAECDTREFCQAEKDDCDADAEAMFDACDASSEPFEVCDQLRSDARFECYCIYDHCVSGEWDPACVEESPAARPPAPVLLGPGQWRVTRRFLDAELARLAGLEAETPIWPVYNPAAGLWRGARLAHVRKDSALHALGLRTGDVLRTVNQIPVVQLLVEPTRALPLRNAGQLRLVIQRGEVTRQLVYQIVP